MEVMVLATRGCSHCKNMSKELNDLQIAHAVRYVEEEPELCQKLQIRHSPNLIVDGKVVFRRQPTEQELKDLFGIRQ